MTDPVMCVTSVRNGKIVHEHLGKILETTNDLLTPPSNDGVYTADGSPPIGKYPWVKPTDLEGYIHVTYAVAIPQDGILVNIPNSHNFLVAVKAAFTIVEQTAMIKFDQIPFTGVDCADITIGLNDGSDPLFVQNPSALARTYFPGTKPQGVFTSLYNYKFALDLQNVNFHYDINEIIRHELGHGIGRVHTTMTVDMMYPIYIARRRSSAMDIYQDQYMYGPRVPPLNPAYIENFYALDAKNLEFTL